jgi:hypothetical protein
VRFFSDFAADLLRRRYELVQQRLQPAADAAVAPAAAQ